MKVILSLFLFVIVVILVALHQNKPIKFDARADSTLVRLKRNKKAIDKQINNKQLIVLVKVPGKKDLVEVKGDSWPDSIDYTLNTCKNASGKIVLIEQTFESESGDWNIIYEHYFDERGYTFAFYKEESIFNDNVKGGIVRQTLLNYYDEKFKNISQASKLLDEKYHPLEKGDNNFDFPADKSSIYKNLQECLAGYNVN